MRSTMLAKLATVPLSALLATCIASAQGKQPNQGPQQKPASSRANASDVEQGQQVFNRNCSRCHKMPEVIPPSVSGTVALHMRIRAGLSEKDYKRLLALLSQ